MSGSEPATAKRLFWKGRNVLIVEKEIEIPVTPGHQMFIGHLSHGVQGRLSSGEVLVRFAVTETSSTMSRCELGILTGVEERVSSTLPSIFDFLRRRTEENCGQFTAVLVVPTGIGAEIGGHAGDAGPVARLLASACDTLITHPNVVNASDINELPENGLYVEGSVLTRLLMGTVGLSRVRSNRVLLVIDNHAVSESVEMAINTASAARAALGLDCVGVILLDPPLRMQTRYASSGSAVGRVEGIDPLCEVLRDHRGEFDAVAISSIIDVPRELHEQYFETAGDMVNPWGGVEAMLTHAVSMLFDVPSAHAPMASSIGELNQLFGMVDPRMSAEVISSAFLYSVLKGLHRSPLIINLRKFRPPAEALTARDVSCLVIPDGCLGLPTLAALEQGIPVIAVRENRNRMRNNLEALPFRRGKLHVVENYLEAVGVMNAMRAGVAVSSVRRPLAQTVRVVARAAVKEKP